MADRSRSSAFIAALGRAEAEGDLADLVALTGPETEHENPTLARSPRGPEGARAFWTAYLAAFRDIRSEFRLVLETDEGAALEWVSRGHAPDGREITYEGVTVLEFAGPVLRRFRAYFDPRALGAQLGASARAA